MLKSGPDLYLGLNVGVLLPFGQPPPGRREGGDVVHGHVAEAIGIERRGLVYRVLLVNLELAPEDLTDPGDVLAVVGDDAKTDQIRHIDERVLVLLALAADLLYEALNALGASLYLDDVDTRVGDEVSGQCAQSRRHRLVRGTCGPVAVPPLL